MNNIDPQFHNLLSDILNNGVRKQTRNGETLSVFGRTIRHKMSEGFPLLTTKKMYWKGIVTELLWFLRGDTNIKYLVDNDCHIWDGDAYKNYEKEFEKDNSIGLSLLVQRTDGKTSYKKPTKEEFIHIVKWNDEFAKTWGELGPIYGKQWRKWEVNEPKEVLRTEGVTWPYEPNPHTYQQRVGTFKIKQTDQIQNLINDLKTNPDSRRLMVSAWNVGELDQMTLPPCHYGFQVYTRELNGEERWDLLRQRVGEEKFKTMVDEIVPFGGGLSEELQSYNIPKRTISLMWNQRSVDTFLGLPFNIASYGLLLLMIADEVGMVPEELIGNLGDTHLYVEHIDAAKEQINRTPYPLPTVKVQDGIFCSSVSDVVLENYQSHPTINAKLLN